MYHSQRPREMARAVPSRGAGLGRLTALAGRQADRLVSDTALTSPVQPNGPHSGRCNAPDAFGISCDTSAWLEPADGRATHGQAARAALTRLEERYWDGALPFLTLLRSGPPARDYLDVGRRSSRDAGLVVHCGGGSLYAGRAFVAAAAAENSHPAATRPPGRVRREHRPGHVRPAATNARPGWPETRLLDDRQQIRPHDRDTRPVCDAS